MRKTIVLFAMVALLWGCADEQATDSVQLREAAALISKSEEGFVPPGETSDLQTYRQKLLSQAAEQLKAALEAGTPEQQVAARQLLADVYASRVRYLQRQAMANWADLANDGVILVSYLMAVDRADSRARLLSADESPLLGELRLDRESTHTQLSQAQQDADGLRRKVSELTAQADQLKGQAGEALAQSQQARSQALAAQGAERFALEDQAAELERRAEVSGSEAEALTVQASVYQDELVLLNKQVELLRGALKAIEEHVSVVEKRQQEAASLVRESQSAKSDALAKMTSQLEELNEAYVERVDKPMADAVATIDEALGLIAGALERAAGSDKRAVQQDRLAHLITKSQLLADHVVITNSRAQLLGMIARQAHRLIPDQARSFSESAQSMQDQRDGFAQDFQQTLEEAANLVTSLTEGAPEGDPVAVVAQQQQERLENCKRRVTEALLAPPQAVAGGTAG